MSKLVSYASTPTNSIDCPWRCTECTATVLERVTKVGSRAQSLRAQTELLSYCTLHCWDDHLVPLPHRIPPEALPESLPPDVKDANRKHSIPDAFLYKPATATERAEYWIVEIKFCRDTDRAGKLEQAREQHRELFKTLCAARTGARIHYMPSS